MKLTSKEIVLQYLIENNKNRQDNTATINVDEASKMELTEKEIIKALYVLESEGCLKFLQKSTHDELDVFWKMELTPIGLRYFEIQKANRKESRNNWIKFWTPVGISILALIIAALSLLSELQLIQIRQLLK